MKKKTADILEYNKIIEILKQQAGSDMATDIISELEPFYDVSKIREAIKETTEAAALIIYKGQLPLSGFYDVVPYAEKARKGGVLEMGQLLQVKNNLQTAARVVNFLKSDVPPMPLIMAIAEVIVLPVKLEKEIGRCILSADEMADDASSDLKRIRREMAKKNDLLRVKLNRIISSSGNKSLLQDSIITVRGGRYVIPVKQENKGKFPGIVHDQSATGATLFIEPQVAVELNNQLRQLQVDEQAEIIRILTELSGKVADEYHSIINNQKLLIQLDVIMAKGKLSVMQKGEAPQIRESGGLVLKEARHPLIPSGRAVPVNISIGKEYRTLVITGPNTGGKTVTLKTAGLLTMMAQSGLHIPASSASVIPVFKDIYADIGDEQSIEQSLSTFSSHMTSIVDIVKESGDGCLVLLDELGAGTDPTEGAALAISILEELYEKGAATIATTHYTELKKYAIATEGVENASMEFDVETLSPTYRLTIGVPGKSNAFEISGKLGLPPAIIDKARLLLDKGDIEFEDVITALEEDKKAAEEERDQALRLNRAMKKQKEELDKKAEELEEKQEKIINDAKAQAREMIKEARDFSREVRDELKALEKEGRYEERDRVFEKNRQRIKDATEKYREKTVKEVNNDPVAPEELRLGDRVKVLTLGQIGEVTTLPDDKGDLTVQAGIIKVKVNVEDIMLVEGGPRNVGRPGKPGKKYGDMFRNKVKTASVTCDVRGKVLDDAAMDVDKYLDDAFMAGLSEVTIIHGKGEGVLKKGIHRMLKSHRHVAGFRTGAFNEGGDGVTIVTLK